jgi:hypothetical protein
LTPRQYANGIHSEEECGDFSLLCTVLFVADVAQKNQNNIWLVNSFCDQQQMAWHHFWWRPT